MNSLAKHVSATQFLDKLDRRKMLLRPYLGLRSTARWAPMWGVDEHAAVNHSLKSCLGRQDGHGIQEQLLSVRGNQTILISTQLEEEIDVGF